MAGGRGCRKGPRGWEFRTEAGLPQKSDRKVCAVRRANRFAGKRVRACGATDPFADWGESPRPPRRESPVRISGFSL